MFTREELMDFNTKYNYVPYKDGAGPTAEATEAFNQLLMKALTEHNIPHTYERSTVYLPEGEMVIRIDGNRSVLYDRWGYYLNTVRFVDEVDNLDNVDLDTMLRYLMLK
jgi:hypothetical protein